MLFRKLSKREEAEFRQWARDNYMPDKETNSLWHPVVRDEWKKMDKQKGKNDGTQSLCPGH